jgi:hypothetical protein
MTNKLRGADLAFRAALAIELMANTTETFSWKEFGKRIGVIRDGEAWQPCHRQQLQAVVNFARAISDASADPLPREAFWRIVNAHTGEPGQGIDRGRPTMVLVH